MKKDLLVKSNFYLFIYITISKCCFFNCSASHFLFFFSFCSISLKEKYDTEILIHDQKVELISLSKSDLQSAYEYIDKVLREKVPV